MGFSSLTITTGFLILPFGLHVLGGITHQPMKTLGAFYYLHNEKNPLCQPSAGTHLDILVIDCGRETLGAHWGPHPSYFARARQGLRHADCRREDRTAETSHEARGN